MCRLLIAGLWVCSLLSLTAAWSDDGVPVSRDGKGRLEATHRQTVNLTPMFEGRKIHLNTFCLDAQGNIVAAVGGSGFVYTEEETAVPASGMIQVYSPDWKLLNQLPLDFVPTALNFDAAGYLYVAGDSVICKLSPEWQLVQRVAAPNLGEPAEMRKKAEEMLDSQRKQILESIQNALDMARKALQAKQEDSEHQEADPQAANNPFSSYPVEQLEMLVSNYERFIEQNASQFEATEERIAEVIRSMGRIISLAVGEQDVYVTCPASTGFGYDVWRMNLDLQEPVVVKERLGGCCGQMDIQAMGDRLVIAENTRFRVGIYDRDGNLVLEFGKQDRRGEEGFGSCCNPMNTRCLPNGDILTAESSIGTIKRFDAQGNLVATIGRARIGGGCKHVALGFDPQRDRYYIMYQDESSICVLEPIPADGAETEAERLAREAAEGLGKWLIGSWKLADLEGAEKNREPGQGQTIADFYSFTRADFGEHGDLMTAGGSFQRNMDESSLKWIPVSQKGHELVVAVEIDLVHTYNLIIRFDDERSAEIFLQMTVREANPMSLGRFAKSDE